MAANRAGGITVVDSDGTRRRFALSPTKQGGRGIAIQSRAWEPGDAQQAWRIPLHPWDAGLNSDRLSNRRSYSKANADTSYNGLLLPPPLVNSVTMTNAVLPSKAKEFDGVLFFVSGRYMYYFNPVTNAVVEDKDFGASKAAVDLEVFNSQLVVAMGETEKIYTRSVGINTSGTANAAVTSTDTTLTDTRLALTVNAYIGATVTCNGKTMVVTSNTATVFTGASWSGGSNPGNGNAWSIAGTWTQATDSTYAIALGLVGARLHRAESTNKLSSCTTAPRTLTSWTPASPNQYPVGDSTYAINTIIDYGGVAWVGKADGMYSPDPASRFINQTPQARSWPNTANCVGSFVAQGYLWVPTSAGLLRIKPGQSKVMGPEIVGRPDYRFWVRGGVEFSGAIYLLVTDEGAVEKTAIIKMVRDDEGLSGREYRYYEWARMASTTKGYVIALTTKGTNPELVNGYGNDIRYVKLGRGGGRDVDDSNCFPANTRIGASSEIVGVSRRAWVGDLTTIKTSAGLNVSATPNHPILTQRGWIGADSIVEGDRILCGPLGQEAGSRNPDKVDADPLIAEVFDLLSILGSRQRTGGVVEQFHGDGQDGEVDVVLVDSQLRDRLQSALTNPASQDVLTLALHGKGRLAPYRLAVQLLCRVIGAAPRVPRMTQPDSHGVTRFMAGSNETGFNHAPDVNPGMAQMGVDGGDGDSVATSDGLSSFPGNVTWDNVVSIGRDPFTGHVYNLQTNSNFYSANGIVVHNCQFGTATELETGKVMPGPDLGVVSILQGVTTVLDFSAAGETLSVSYKVDGDGAYADLLNTQEGGGTAPISSTTNFQAVTRYAPTTAAGQFFEFKFTGALTSATGTNRPEILEAWAFGYSRPKVTDVVTVAIHAGPGTAGVNGIPNGQSAEETIRLFRNWLESSTVLTCEIPEYEQGRTTRFLVTGVEVAEQTATVGQQHETTTSRVMVALTRVDVAGAYAD